MKAILAVSIMFALFGCNATTPQKEPSASAPLTAQESAQIKRIAETGKEIYTRDIRAADASDLVLARIYPANYPHFVGWVTYPNNKDYTVSFYEKSGDNITIVADVIYDEMQTPDIHIEPNRAPEAFEVSMLNARLAALEHGTSSCSQRFNTVVIPGDPTEEWDVFVLAATTDPQVAQVGGHTKVSVSKAGDVTRVEPLSKSCLVLDKSPGNIPEGASVKMLTVSHIVGHYPAETHVYLSLLHGIPFAVLTERGVWLVKDGDIEFVK